RAGAGAPGARQRGGPGEAGGGHGGHEGPVRQPAVPHAHDLRRDLPGRRAGLAGLGGAAAQPAVPAGASVAAHDPLRLPVLGIIVPDMGMRAGKRVSEAAALYASASLSAALFTATPQRVLSLLFGQPGRAMSVSELIQATGAGSGAVQREIARLAGSGLLVSEQVGNQKRYSANPRSPIHDELVGIVRKTFGLVAPLQE